MRGDLFPHSANAFDVITNLAGDLPRRGGLIPILHTGRADQRPPGHDAVDAVMASAQPQ